MQGYIGPGSRYTGLAAREHTLPDGRAVLHLERRLPPRPETLETLGTLAMRPGQRLDHAAAEALGDPLLFWALCDASGALRPAELERPGAVVRVAGPPGAGGLALA